MENKTRKYFKYAVGEIILVVIGILIAIQLNDWNNYRQEKKVAKSYISALISDIKKDTTELNDFIRQAKEGTLELDNLLKTFSQHKVNTDSIKSIMKNDFNLFYFPLKDFNSQTISTLITTGDIKILPRHIQSALLKLKNTQKTSLDFIGKGIDFYNPILTEYSNKYPFYNPNNIKSQLAEQIWNNTDERDFLRTVYAVLSKKRTMYNTFLNNGNPTLDDSIKLLNLLSEEYPNIQ